MIGDYYVTIDEVNITGNMYYVITVLRHPKCENCRKALTDAVTDYTTVIIGTDSGVTFQPRTQNFL